MRSTNPHTLSTLEWGSICELLRQRAVRSRNQEAFAALRPAFASRASVDRRLEDVAAFQRLLEDGPLLAAGLPEVDDFQATLKVQGESLDAPSLFSLARFAEVCAELGRAARSRFQRAGLTSLRFLDEAGELSRMGDLAFVKAVFSAIGATGEILDDASVELRRIRVRTHRLRDDLDRVFDSYLQRKDSFDILQDKVVASRNGRSVLMVKAEAKRSFGGVVHGASRSANTAFIEPAEAVEVNNQIVEASEEEQEEIRRILRHLSDLAREDLSLLRRSLAIVETWDELHAIALLARDLGARSASFSGGGDLRIVRGVHPLLIPKIRADLDLPPAVREPVPLEIEMSAERRILVIGGPNTGGKTVALKTVGLLALMARSGLPVPAAEGTVLPFFDAVFAEIGDEQSLGAGLSTFSAQIAGIAAMEIPADGRSLVLLDELGSGTDPLEGGALGAAIIDDFAQRGAMVLATTHNADLKLFAQESPIGRCASFAYDPASFAPTYKLVLDQPGRSLAFEIATRLGVPSRVAEEARARLPESARRQEALLADLVREKREISERRHELEMEQRDARDLKESLEKKLARIDDERERMREDMRGRIQAARETEDKRLRALFAEAEEKLRQAKSERAVGRVRSETLSQVHPPVAQSDVANAGTLAVGDHVEAVSLGWRGAITALTESDVEIESRGKRIKLARSLVTLEPLSRRKAGPAPMASRGSTVRDDVPSGAAELKLIGLRVDEALPLVDKFLDDAFLADSPSIRIVHGFGQGRLRNAVRDLLKSHPHVTGFRDGSSHEGGAGATVVDLRR